MISSPQNTHVRSAVSPQQSIQEENEQPEVVGAGLPLIKRLLLLKAKEEREKTTKDTVKVSMISTIRYICVNDTHLILQFFFCRKKTSKQQLN